MKMNNHFDFFIDFDNDERKKISFLSVRKMFLDNFFHPFLNLNNK